MYCIHQWAPQGPTQVGPIPKQIQGEFCSFSSFLPMKQLFSHHLSLPNIGRVLSEWALRPLLKFMCAPFIRGRKTNRHKQISGVVPGLGGWQDSVYVCFQSLGGVAGFCLCVWGVIPCGEKNHINIIPQIPGTIPRKFCLGAFLRLFFFAPSSLRSVMFVVDCPMFLLNT